MLEEGKVYKTHDNRIVKVIAIADVKDYDLCIAYTKDANSGDYGMTDLNSSWEEINLLDELFKL